jgi:hypothetical protein
MGIAVMSQLLICSSRVTDFQIDKIDREAIPLIQHPDSFRTTLVQIANEAYNAFMKANINMEKIKSQMAKVPSYVKDCVKIIKSDNKVAIERLLPRRLECIKQVADGGQKLSAKVSQAFDFIGQLNPQVLLAITASQGAKEKEIQAAIKAYNAEAKKKSRKATGDRKTNKNFTKGIGRLQAINKRRKTLDGRIPTFTRSSEFGSRFLGKKNEKL